MITPTAPAAPAYTIKQGLISRVEVTEEGEAFYTEKIEFDDPVTVSRMDELIRLAVDFGRATKSDEVAAAFDDLLEDGYETPE